jgi:hypothetical protein
MVRREDAGELFDEVRGNIRTIRAVDPEMNAKVAVKSPPDDRSDVVL